MPINKVPAVPSVKEDDDWCFLVLRYLDLGDSRSGDTQCCMISRFDDIDSTFLSSIEVEKIHDNDTGLMLA